MISFFVTLISKIGNDFYYYLKITRLYNFKHLLKILFQVERLNLFILHQSIGNLTCPCSKLSIAFLYYNFQIRMDFHKPSPCIWFTQQNLFPIIRHYKLLTFIEVFSKMLDFQELFLLNPFSYFLCSKISSVVILAMNINSAYFFALYLTFFLVKFYSHAQFQ